MSRFLVATTGHSVPLPGGETYVGTDPAVEIPVRGDMGLMPRHFVIAPAASGWQLAAFDGAMVLVNGLQVRHTEIHDGDQIVAGQLALTYRDEQEAAMAMPALTQMPQAMASLTQNSFPSLQTGPLRVEEEGEGRTMARPPVVEPERAAPPRILLRTELGDVTSVAAGKRDHLLMILIGLVLIVLGGGFAKLAFFDKSGPLKAEDIVIKEGHITGVSVNGRKASRTTELLTDLGLTRMIQLPDDLPYNPVWSRPGSVAKIGFAKEEFNLVGTQVRLEVATLEVGGTTYRSLAKYNTSHEGQNQTFGIAAVGMVLAGLLVMMMGWEKWKTRQAER
ncbi:MAG: hypothetical protein JWR15_1111 [Prosthecobacter sp.]|nr:hypothetical protein [Prosthecobacter sp.]